MPNNELSYDTLLALYFAIRAARNGTTVVKISNEDLKWYLLRGESGKRLSAKLIKEFAITMTPIFPRNAVKKSKAGHLYLVLYMTEKAGAVEHRDHVNLAPVSKPVINQTLGIEPEKK